MNPTDPSHNAGRALTLLAPLLEGRRRVAAPQGESGGCISRYEVAGEPTLYGKSGRGSVAEDITAEFVRLRWLARRVPCPTVHGFAAVDDEAMLLTTAMPGRSAWEMLTHDGTRGEAIAAAVGSFLRSMHALPVEDCPFDASVVVRVAAARYRVESGLVDESDFADAYAGWSAREILQDVEGALPLVTERVVTHGDFSLGNIMVDGAEVTGIIDVGRVGVADPYQDLAILHENLEEFGPAVQAAMWRAYGVTDPDPARLRLHLQLDELF